VHDSPEETLVPDISNVSIKDDAAIQNLSPAIAQKCLKCGKRNHVMSGCKSDEVKATDVEMRSQLKCMGRKNRRRETG